MHVVKRDGRREPVQFDKITARIKKLCYGLHDSVDPVKIAMRVIEGVYDGVTTTELDNLAAEVAATNAVSHPDYASLASRIAVSNLHKSTHKSFAETMHELYTYIDPVTGANASLIADDVMDIVKDHGEFLDSTIIYDRDFNYDYFGFKTLERAYLMSCGKEIVERPQVRLGMPCDSTCTTPHAPLTSSKIQIPHVSHGPSSSPTVQHMILRVALGIHGRDIEAALETYELMSRQVPHRRR